MSLVFSRGDIWNRGDPKREALASWCACVRSCGVPAFALGIMAIPKESAVDTNSETASSYAIGGAMTRARTTALLNFSQCMYVYEGEKEREREEREGDTHRCTEGRRNESRERENEKVREAGQLYVYVCRAVALDFDAIL